MYTNHIFIIVFLFFSSCFVMGQEFIRELSLQETIELARKHSPYAQTARHSFRSAYWNYRSYRADYLPSLSLYSDPYLYRDINKITLEDGTVRFVRQDQINTDLNLVLNQNIILTGGSLTLQTNVQRLDILNNHIASWQSAPINIGYSQSLFGYNYLKWNKKIEPLRYEAAKKSYAETLELVAVQATGKFFALATAQSNYEIACLNYADADTLFRYAKGRYNIGTITENEMLQLEVNKLSEETNMLDARIEVDNCMYELRSYLGIAEDIDLKVLTEEYIPDFSVNLEDALKFATTNSPDIQYMLQRKLESESSVAYAKASTGLKTDIYLRFGLTQTADRLSKAYQNPMDQQYISLGISLPILDWGRGKGKVKVAKSNRDLVYTQLEQERTDFELNVRKIVKQFNLQTQRVRIAARTEETARKRHEVAKRLFLSGKSTILDLNASINEKDISKRNYLNALYQYWSLYYTLRSITLYDFEKQVTIAEEYEVLIKERN